MNERTVSTNDLQKLLFDLTNVCFSLDKLENAVCMNYKFSSEVLKTEITIGQGKKDEDNKNDDSVEQKANGRISSAVLMEALENEGILLLGRLQQQFQKYISER